jgi:hypothetical protein
MGRKRLDKPKKTITLRVDAEIYEQLTKDGVNKSRLFSIAGRKYLKKKHKLYNSDN